MGRSDAVAQPRSPPFQARNIAVCLEFRDSDEVDARPLKVG